MKKMTLIPTMPAFCDLFTASTLHRWILRIKRGTSTMFLWGLIFALPLHAAAPKDDEDRLPTGCLDTGYHFKMKTVTLLPHEAGQPQSMFFLHNTSAEPLNLYQMRGEESDRSLYLNHTINPNQWAVLATSEDETRFICTHPDKKISYGRIVDCADNVKVCQFTRVRFGLNNKGNFWIVSSTTRNAAVSSVVHYGIIP